MNTKYPDFFKDRTEPWTFEDVLSFINSYFEKKEGFKFRIGKKENSANENQGAGLILAYAQLMDYTFNQVKALFSEHDHFAIAIPETKKGRNILEFNTIFYELLKKGHPFDIKLSQFPELFDVPKDVLKLKR